MMQTNLAGECLMESSRAVAPAGVRVRKPIKSGVTRPSYHRSFNSKTAPVQARVNRRRRTPGSRPGFQ